MVEVPKAYPTPPPQAIATFDFVDIAEGTGIVRFFGSHNKVETTDNYFLTRQSTPSNDIDVNNPDVSNASLTKVEDLDFDLAPFNLPKDLVGTAYASLPLRILRGSGSNAVYFIVKLRKWDGSTETEIASAQSETRSGTTDQGKNLQLQITVPLTHFQRGETLRITVEVWQVGESPGNPNGYWVAFDPSGRTTTEFGGAGDFKATTVMLFDMPFRINT